MGFGCGVLALAAGLAGLGFFMAVIGGFAAAGLGFATGLATGLATGFATGFAFVVVGLLGVVSALFARFVRAVSLFNAGGFRSVPFKRQPKL